MTTPARLRQYYVTWEIDIFDVDNPLEAACAALDIQRDPTSQATVFTVHGEWGSTTVDLDGNLLARSEREFSAAGVSA